MLPSCPQDKAVLFSGWLLTDQSSCCHVAAIYCCALRLKQPPELELEPRNFSVCVLKSVKKPTSGTLAFPQQAGGFHKDDFADGQDSHRRLKFHSKKEICYFCLLLSICSKDPVHNTFIYKQVTDQLAFLWLL